MLNAQSVPAKKMDIVFTLRTLQSSRRDSEQTNKEINGERYHLMLITFRRLTIDKGAHVAFCNRGSPKELSTTALRHTLDVK